MSDARNAIFQATPGIGPPAAGDMEEPLRLIDSVLSAVSH